MERAQIEKLLGWAILSPNHHLTEPWRFRVCMASHFEEFLGYLQSRLAPEQWLPLKSASERLRTAGAFIFLTAQQENPPIRAEENYAAVCAAAQTLLLGATALGLQSFWSSGLLMRHALTREYFQIPANEAFVGSFWLGHAKLPEPTPRSPIEAVTQWFE